MRSRSGASSFLDLSQAIAPALLARPPKLTPFIPKSAKSSKNSKNPATFKFISGEREH
ncbi:hypothetical protein [Coleofasciculus sp. FACHB-501]|uniref:hypothetical protein n=1 Tax=Cyanophyceae TaxID=3028117 RepID=UPI001685F93A|nr:hypothetical protein [Coleofasciculus sp. FACHB-501]MBD1837795.1 hypothetical protein [Coleofasciculus sp. FACHB-501]